MPPPPVLRTHTPGVSVARSNPQPPGRVPCYVSSGGELELELIQSHMAQKPVLRGEVGCACVAREVSVERGGIYDRTVRLGKTKVVDLDAKIAESTVRTTPVV